MSPRVVTVIGVLITLLWVQDAWADPTVKVMGAQGKTATKKAKITFGLENADGKVLAATEPYLDTLTIDGTNVAVDSVAQTGGNTAMGILTWASGGPDPGDHTVKITVKLKGGGTATMNVATIKFVE